MELTQYQNPNRIVSSNFSAVGYKLRDSSFLASTFFGVRLPQPFSPRNGWSVCDFDILIYLEFRYSRLVLSILVFFLEEDLHGADFTDAFQAFRHPQEHVDDKFLGKSIKRDGGVIDPEREALFVGLDEALFD